MKTRPYMVWAVREMSEGGRKNIRGWIDPQGRYYIKGPKGTFSGTMNDELFYQLVKMAGLDVDRVRRVVDQMYRMLLEA